MAQAKRVGYDVEYAVNTSAGFIPAGRLPIKGRKGNPEQLTNGGVEIDCCAVEITPPPAQDEDTFVNNLLNLLNEVKKKYNTVELVTKPSVYFDHQALKGARFAMEMGCDPDFCVWTGEQNPRPEAHSTGLRTFGGHVHVEGGTPSTVKALDLTLGMWSVIMDKDKDRRKLYGRAGAFRFKPYGIEYRVLSNFWCDDPEKIRMVYRLVVQAREMIGIEEWVNHFGGEERIQSIINDSKEEEAMAILDELNIKYEV